MASTVRKRAGRRRRAVSGRLPARGEHQEIPDTKIRRVAYCERPRFVLWRGNGRVCPGRSGHTRVSGTAAGGREAGGRGFATTTPDGTARDLSAGWRRCSQNSSGRRAIENRFRAVKQVDFACLSRCLEGFLKYLGYREERVVQTLLYAIVDALLDEFQRSFCLYVAARHLERNAIRQIERQRHALDDIHKNTNTKPRGASRLTLHAAVILARHRSSALDIYEQGMIGKICGEPWAHAKPTSENPAMSEDTNPQENQPIPRELREALARREEARAKLRMAESELAKQRAEVALTKADVLRKDEGGVVPLRMVMRW